jgi:hypothetical protein
MHLSSSANASASGANTLRSEVSPPNLPAYCSPSIPSPEDEVLALPATAPFTPAQPQARDASPLASPPMFAYMYAAPLVWENGEAVVLLDPVTEMQDIKAVFEDAMWEQRCKAVIRWQYSVATEATVRKVRRMQPKCQWTE